MISISNMCKVENIIYYIGVDRLNLMDLTTVLQCVLGASDYKYSLTNYSKKCPEHWTDYPLYIYNNNCNFISLI